MKFNSYFKNEKLAKIIMSVLLFLIIMLVAGIFVVKAEDNETKKVVLKEWTTQLLYDTTNACYEGTIRWVLLSHPSLLGQPPNWRSQRQMVILFSMVCNCFVCNRFDDVSFYIGQRCRR